jgi:peptide deformylase
VTEEKDALAIERLGAPVLREPAPLVETVDDDVRGLVHRMFTTMYVSNGQGLAAPQVGVSRRLAIVDVPPHEGPSYVLVNPRLVSTSEERVRGVEGCLSIPGVRANVERPARVVVEAMDLDGQPVRLEAGGELARCLQHEIDHLDGMLYPDRLPLLARRMLLARYRKLQRRSDP